MIYFVSACALLLLFLLLQTLSKLRESERQHQATRLNLKSQIEEKKSGYNKEIQRLLDVLPYAFFSISSEGKVIRYNKNARRIFKERNILGRSIRQIFLDAPIIADIEKTIQKPTPYNRIIRLPPSSPFSVDSPHKDSHWKINLQPVSIKADTLEIQLMMRDISTNLHADQIRQDFVANASHELRTPLSIISGYLENLTEEGALENQDLAQKMLSTVDRHVIRINHIVEEMLLISKLESEESPPLKIATFNLAICIRDIIERLDLVIEKQKATVIEKVPELTMSGDQFYWTQILFNLVENALKQNTSSPVTITIKALQKKNGDLSIEVRDNGIGIPSKDLPFIFKRFFRVEKHHSQSEIKGTGLGLSIVKRAIEAHGGKISVNSTPGVQTTFTINAPQNPLSKDTNLPA